MLTFVIRNIKVFRSVQIKVLLYNSLVRSVLAYCSVFWRPHFTKHSLRIKRNQKLCLYLLAYCKGMPKRSSYKLRLGRFNINSLKNRRDWLDLVFLYTLLRNKIDSPILLKQIRFRVSYKYPRYHMQSFCPPL